MGSKKGLSSYCTKRANNGVNLVTSRKINTRLARPIVEADAVEHPIMLSKCFTELRRNSIKLSKCQIEI